MELPRYGVDCSTVKGPQEGCTALATLGSVTSGKQQLESAQHRTAQQQTVPSFTFVLVSTTTVLMFIYLYMFDNNFDRRWLDFMDMVCEGSYSTQKSDICNPRIAHHLCVVSQCASNRAPATFVDLLEKQYS